MRGPQAVVLNGLANHFGQALRRYLNQIRELHVSTDFYTAVNVVQDVRP
jgi:hypothetical protein